MEVPIKELYHKLLNQKIEHIKDLDNLFDPSDYLVSPFNSTDKFMENKYFLTIQQETYFKEIVKKLKDENTRFIALTGSAGTGKTLLTYHIAKRARSQGIKVLILHCGSLNNGHCILKEQYGWSIYNPKNAPALTNFDIVIIDETQRIYPYQFEKYIRLIQENGIKCIFSFDANQYLRDAERSNAITESIEKDLSCKPYVLTSKIRTNKEIADFIRSLFNNKRNFTGSSYSNIWFSYYRNHISAKSLLDRLANDGWKTPQYTPGTISTFHYEKYSSHDKDSAHSVIGQEFDKVAVVLDDQFAYAEDGMLYADNTYYSQRQMLYQIITRTRKQLYVIIINNPIILNRVIDIINNSDK